ncbi:Uncharacterised protein [Mycobacteroides abscessus subsp. abscessus]|nr:Uncharacterised protein [Mycobacteroides abscessus subsp. abscessus]
MRGRAIPMIEVSMMTMNWAVAITARAHHFRVVVVCTCVLMTMSVLFTLPR